MTLGISFSGLMLSISNCPGMKSLRLAFRLSLEGHSFEIWHPASKNSDKANAFLMRLIITKFAFIFQTSKG